MVPPPVEGLLVVDVALVVVVEGVPGALVVVVPGVLPPPGIPNQARSTASWTGTVWPTFWPE